MDSSSELDIAVRAHTVRQSKKPTPQRTRKRREQLWQTTWPDLTLVFDCETTVDPSQRLTFGFYRVTDGGQLVEEGLLVADEVSETDRATIAAFAATTRQGDNRAAPRLVVRTREGFLREVFFPVANERRGVVVGFNLPFDLSRLACEVGDARKRYRGGFSFTFLTYIDNDGIERPDKFIPRIAIKAIDSKRARIGLTSNWKGDSPRHASANGRSSWSGHFVDLRTLVYALTGEPHSLDSACAAFGISDGKREVEEHGKITPKYLAYARQDVWLTAELYRRALAEYRCHPIDLPPDKAYSTATIGKAYLRAMGVRPPTLRIDPGLDLTDDMVHGFAMTTYYGGRAECRIRGVPVLVVYCDFRSMYPTVNALMGLWRFLTARELRVMDTTEQTQALLERIEADDLFRPEAWKDFAVLVQIAPGDDVVPVRAPYAGSSGSYTIGHNPLASTKPLWYTLPDLIASKLVTGKVPRVLQAIRFVPKGRQKGLQTVLLRSSVAVDPRQDDFFREVIRARGAVKRDTELPEAERRALQLFLKVLANATSYGIFVQLDRQDGETAEIDVFSADHFTTSVTGPEEPGDFYFPPLGALITGAARLMLALAEHEVVRRGGTHAFMDTDSIAIVATGRGGLISCPGGPAQLGDGAEAIHSLSCADVETIREKFSSLNPYGDGDSILELEDENYAVCGIEGHKPSCVCTKERRALSCLAIAAKRYCLFNRDGDGIVVRKATEHGLGAYLPPTDPDTKKPVKGWMTDAWERIALDALGLETGAWLTWTEQLARTRLSISTPTMLNWFRRWNARDPKKLDGPQKPYASRVKPFGFLDHAPLDPGFGTPVGMPTSAKFNLVAPRGEPRWWVNLHDPNGPRYRVIGHRPESADATIVVGRTLRDVIAAHPFHPEPKSLGHDGQPCHAHTSGVLSRRAVAVRDVLALGKEANDLDRVEAGLVDELDDVLTVYERDQWEEVRRVLATMPVGQIMAGTGYSRRQVFYLRSGQRRPSVNRTNMLLALCCEASKPDARCRLNRRETAPPGGVGAPTLR